jgi:hypothetical protein
LQGDPASSSDEEFSGQQQTPQQSQQQQQSQAQARSAAAAAQARSRAKLEARIKRMEQLEATGQLGSAFVADVVASRMQQVRAAAAAAADLR